MQDLPQSTPATRDTPPRSGCFATTVRCLPRPAAAAQVDTQEDANEPGAWGAGPSRSAFFHSSAQLFQHGKKTDNPYPIGLAINAGSRLHASASRLAANVRVMVEPSQYELDAWSDIQTYRGRQVTRRLEQISQKVSDGTASVAGRATKYIERSPRARAALDQRRSAAAHNARASSDDPIDPSPARWDVAAKNPVLRTAGRISRAGLSPKRVVAKHQKRGHDVVTLNDLRRLDLAEIDDVRGRAASWLYPASAALSGAGAGLVYTGGALAVTASAGAAAAPSGGAIAGAFMADTTAVLALGSRVVGRTALLYGYDPESPAEKLFIMSVVNAGTAVSAGAKTAAMSDVSRLTQALVRGKTWDVLNESLLTKVASRFAARFSFRLTKQGLGKVVPLAGVGVGIAFNWATIEGILDAADVAYRRRFLLEKYPHFAAADTFGAVIEAEQISDDADQEISVLAELADAGGPDIE